ncbi:MAG: M15 family metallopeptidase, partial [Spirochaetota bacterium]|nr:M15 family metallopeptidase [Spirochaetota bacterium]
MDKSESTGTQNLAIGQEKVDKWNALPLSYEPDDLVLLPDQYKAVGYETREMLMRAEVLEAFIAMLRSARGDGVEIGCVSAYRSAKYQAEVYQRAIEKEGEHQVSSAKPGHSEHQLGTAVDISCPEVENCLVESFSETKAYEWLCQNAHQHG